MLPHGFVITSTELDPYTDPLPYPLDCLKFLTDLGLLSGFVLVYKLAYKLSFFVRYLCETKLTTCQFLITP